MKIVLIRLMFLLMIILSPIIILIFAVLWFQYSYPRYVKASIPAKIEIVQTVTSDPSFGVGGGGSCSGASFKLSEKTLKEIEQEGISYFNNALISEPVTYRTKTEYWRPWRESPVKNKEEFENTDIPYGCLTNFKKFMDENKHLINPNTKNYFTYVTHRGYANMWVFPDLKIIAYSMFE